MHEGISHKKTTILMFSVLLMFLEVDTAKGSSKVNLKNALKPLLQMFCGEYF